MKYSSLILLLAACSHSKPADSTTKTDTAAPATGEMHEFKIGALSAYALKDGDFTLPNDGKTFGAGHTPQEIGEVLSAGGLPTDTVSVSIQPLLVKDGDHVLLFDAGAAGMAPSTGRMAASLAMTGVTPDQITDIFISHRHGDHTGGLVAGGKLAFPNATIHICKPDWDKLQADPEGGAAIAAVISAKVDAFEPGATLLPEVTAIDTRGHTDGHESYDIHSGDEHLFYLGDVLHHSLISVQHPDWGIAFDGDNPQAAIATRVRVLGELTASGAHVYAVHFPFPGLGHFADGAWKAD